MVFPRQPSEHLIITETEIASVEKESYEETVDAIIASSVIGTSVISEQHGQDLDGRVMADPIQDQVCSMSGVFDVETLCGMLNQRISKAKFSSAVGSTTASLNQEGCELFVDANPQGGSIDDLEADVGADWAVWMVYLQKCFRRYGVSTTILQNAQYCTLQNK